MEKKTEVPQEEPDKKESALEEEVKDDISEYDKEQLVDFRSEIQVLKAKEGGSHVQEINPDLLGNEEHRLWKFFKKYKSENWPKIRVTAFERKLNEYDARILQPLVNEKGHKDPEVKTKENFIAYLRTVVTVEGNEEK